MGVVGSSEEKRIWPKREIKTKARRKTRRSPSLVRRTKEKRKKIRRTNECPVLSGKAFSGVGPETSRAMLEYYDPAIDRDGATRSFAFTWPGDYEVGNLIIQLPGTVKGDRRLLMGHMDTVPLCRGAVPVRKGARIVSKGRMWIKPGFREA